MRGPQLGQRQGTAAENHLTTVQATLWSSETSRKVRNGSNMGPV